MFTLILRMAVHGIGREMYACEIQHGRGTSMYTLKKFTPPARSVLKILSRFCPTLFLNSLSVGVETRLPVTRATACPRKGALLPLPICPISPSQNPLCSYLVYKSHISRNKSHRRTSGGLWGWCHGNKFFPSYFANGWVLAADKF